MACACVVQAVGLAWDIRLPTEAQKRKMAAPTGATAAAPAAPSNDAADGQLAGIGTDDEVANKPGPALVANSHKTE